MHTLASLDALLLRAIVFSQPIRSAWPPSWLTHIPFAFWIVDALKPAVFVELGTHSGNSYASFAQAVQTLELGTACYAVDTWQGDKQAGFYDETVFTDWSAFHDRHFGGFSRLVRSTFDDARATFADRSIDLLHIDGLHTYDAISHDFESWLPKLSARGLVLLHDINVREGDFGAWRLWDEIQARYPTFAFLHGHGLGIVAVGTELPPDVRWLVSELPQLRRESSMVQQFFARLGVSLEREREIDAFVDERRMLTSRVTELDALAQQRGDERDALVATIQQQHDTDLRDTIDTRTALEIEATRRAMAEARADVEVQHHTEDVDRLRDALEQMAQELTDQTDHEQALRIERDRLRESLVELDQECAAADADAASLRIALAKALREQGSLKRALATATRELGNIHGSRRWRLTAPIGRLGALGLGSLLQVRNVGAAAAATRVLVNPRRLVELRCVALSGLFDECYYVSRYDDVRRSRMPAIMHYVIAGAREGRAPHPLFDGTFYLARHHDVRIAGANPLVHYLRTAAKERRDPHPLFSVDYYVAQHPELATLQTDPLVHYLSADAGDGSSPHPLFDPEFYLEQNPDAGKSGTNAFVHFLEHGAREGRAPHPLFDTAFYLRQNADVNSAGINPLVHYLEHVPGEDRDPHPLFDSSYYLSHSPDLVVQGVNPLLHFVDHGWREGRRPNPAFDPRWYLETNPDVAASGQNALEHFVRFGWREGRDPSPEFSTADYMAAHPDIAATGTNPLLHYLQHGAREGRAITRSRATTRRLPTPKSVALRVDGVASPHGSFSSPTVVCVSHVIPWPPRAGNEYRVLRMLKWLVAEGYRVLLLLAPLPTESVSVEQLDALASRIGNVAVCGRDGEVTYSLQSCPDVFADLEGRRTQNYASRLGERAQLLPRELELLRIDRTFCHDVLIESLLHVLSRLERSVLLAEYVWMTRVLPLVDRRVPTVLDTHDMYSTKADKVLSFGVADWTLSTSEEAARLARADLVLAIQDRERALMHELVPSTEVITVGVDFDAPGAAPRTTTKSVLVVGSANEINRTGLRDFLRFAWPSILARVPDAILVVAGHLSRYVPDDAPNIESLGAVDDLTPLYGRARVVVNPAAAGTGLKIKTVEALSHGCPVVTWPNGFDGIPEAIQRTMTPPNDWLEFAEQVVRQLQNETSAIDPATRSAIHAFVSPSAAYAALGDHLKRLFERTAIPS